MNKFAEHVKKQIAKSASSLNKVAEGKEGYVVIWDDDRTYLKYDQSDKEFDINSSDYMTLNIEEAKVYPTREEAEKASYFDDGTRVIFLKKITQEMVNSAVYDMLSKGINSFNKESAYPMTKEQFKDALTNFINKDLDSFFE
jgi:hypothetical protein